MRDRKTGPAKRQANGWKAVRLALLDRTGKTKQWLSAEVAKRTRRVAMPVRVAQAVVAHENGVRISRFLSGADLSEVQQAHRDLAQLGATAASKPQEASKSNGKRPQKAAGAARALTFRGANVTTSDPFLPKAKLEEARAMSNVYPLLYVLENSIREVIRRVMTARFGSDWWVTEIAGRLNNVNSKVVGRLNTERAKSWHQRRGAHQIDYTDFEDLLSIAQSKPELFFPTILGEIEFFRSIFRDVAPSRNVVCHMNPLSENNETDIGVKLRRWEEHLKNRRAEIEVAMTP